jgi:carboxymethylenebutenolidase
MRRTSALVLALAVAALPGRATPARGDEPPAEHHHPIEVPVATSTASGSREIEAVEREHRHDAPTPSPAAQASPRRGVSIMEGFAYAKLGKEGKPVMGYAAAALGPEPPKAAILVIHEWWGVNDNIQSMVRRLAGEGYAALAVDLYEGQTASDPEHATALMQASLKDPARLIDNLKQARAWLDGQFHPAKVGVIGWCYGGGWSLRTALALPDRIDAAVVYYGQPIADPQELGKLKAPLLGHFGELDQAFKVPDVRAMEAQLQKLGKNATIYVYPGADHAFANPSGGRYNEAAAQEAWQRTVAFLQKYLN